MRRLWSIIQKALEQGYNENWIKKEITQLEGLLEERNEKA